MLTSDGILKTMRQMASFGEGQHFHDGRNRRRPVAVDYDALRADEAAANPARVWNHETKLFESPEPQRPDPDEPGWRWCDTEMTYV